MDQIQVFHIAGRFFTIWATRKPERMKRSGQSGNYIQFWMWEMWKKKADAVTCDDRSMNQVNVDVIK